MTTACVVAGGAAGPEAELGTVVGGATHWVQIVDVIVLMMVEIDDVTCNAVLVPEVTVFVTGQVVRVV